VFVFIIFMNNIPVVQLQIASLVEELLSLREGFVTFDCGNVFLLFFLMPLVLSDGDESLLMNNSHSTFYFSAR